MTSIKPRPFDLSGLGKQSAGSAHPAVDREPLAGLRVLIVVENLPVPFDRRVWLEAQTLSRAGAHVSVICPTGTGAEERFQIIDGIEIHRYPLPTDARGAIGYLREYGAAIYWQLLLAFRVWRLRGFDIIQGCNPPDLVFLIAWAFRPFGVRYIFDHHDICPELYEAKFQRRDLFWRALRLIERLSFLSATVTMATNESYRAIALGRGGKRPEDVFVVRSGPDLSRLGPVSPDPAWRQGRAYMVAYVGVMGEQEGIDLLLEAVSHIVHKQGRQDIQFVLVGGGPCKSELQRASSTLGLDAHVTFTGRVPDSLLFTILSTADICVNPDRVNPMNDKSTMNKIMEYMAFGRPIVQFEVAEGRVSAQESSLYARANEPTDMARLIVELIDDPERREHMGALGLARVTEALGWDKSVAPLIAAYQRASQRI